MKHDHEALGINKINNEMKMIIYTVHFHLLNWFGTSLNYQNCKYFRDTKFKAYILKDYNLNIEYFPIKANSISRNTSSRNYVFLFKIAYLINFTKPTGRKINVYTRTHLVTHTLGRRFSISVPDCVRHR